MAMILLRNALLFDGLADAPQERIDVLIDGQRIVEVSSTPIKSTSARSIDLAGNFLMPGLIDAHFHAVLVDANLARLGHMPRSLNTMHAARNLEAALMRGFTTLRDAGGADHGLVKAIEAGLLQGPRLFHSGKVISPTGGHGDSRSPEAIDCAFCGPAGLPFAHIADGVDQVRKAAREELRKGATQIKIMASGGVASPSDPIWNLQYSEEEIAAAVWEARSWRTYVMAHAYTPEAIARALKLGVRSIEHANLIDEPTAKLAKQLDAWIVPTLVTYEALDKFGRQQGFPEVSLRKLSDVLAAGATSLEILSRTGNNIGFGTDLLGDMHQHQSREFSIRAEVMKPAAVLKQATSNNGELLNRDGELGVVKPGALADLIAVDGNPLDNVNLLEHQGRHISLIVKDGAVIKNTL
ncbi:MAG: amidohydrolase family protein [Rhodospirillales bacterium]